MKLREQRLPAAILVALVAGLLVYWATNPQPPPPLWELPMAYEYMEFSAEDDAIVIRKPFFTIFKTQKVSPRNGMILEERELPLLPESRVAYPLADAPECLLCVIWEPLTGRFERLDLVDTKTDRLLACWPAPQAWVPTTQVQITAGKRTLITWPSDSEGTRGVGVRVYDCETGCLVAERFHPLEYSSYFPIHSVSPDGTLATRTYMHWVGKGAYQWQTWVLDTRTGEIVRKLDHFVADATPWDQTGSKLLGLNMDYEAGAAAVEVREAASGATLLSRELQRGLTRRQSYWWDSAGWDPDKQCAVLVENYRPEVHELLRKKSGFLERLLLTEPQRTWIEDLSSGERRLIAAHSSFLRPKLFKQFDLILIPDNGVQANKLRDFKLKAYPLTGTKVIPLWLRVAFVLVAALVSGIASYRLFNGKREMGHLPATPAPGAIKTF